MHNLSGKPRTALRTPEQHVSTDNDRLRLPTFRGESPTDQTLRASEMIIDLEGVRDHDALVLSWRECDVGLVGA